MKTPPVKAAPTGPLSSPTDIGLLDRVSPEDRKHLIPNGFAHFFWEADPAFPGYLRGLREAAGMSLREAAEAIDYSLAGMSRMETGENLKPPKMERLHRLAELYGVDPREMMHRAGIRVELPGTVDLRELTEQHFEDIFLHPDVRPPLIDKDSLPYFSHRMKKAILSFAEKLAELDDPKAFLREQKAKRNAGQRR